MTRRRPFSEPLPLLRRSKSSTTRWGSTAPSPSNTSTTSPERSAATSATRYYSHSSAFDSVVDRLPVTFELAGLTITVSVLVALGLAIATARVRGRWFTRGVDGITLVGLSIPTFWSGLLLLLLFGLYWPGIVPAGGWVFVSESADREPEELPSSPSSHSASPRSRSCTGPCVRR